MKEDNRATKVYSIADVMAVAVIYNTSLSECTSLTSLNASAAFLNEQLQVVVYDNSPHPQNAEKLAVHSHLHCTYVHDVTNPGVSKAYNYGASVAGKQHKTFLLLVDQDTFFPDKSIGTYLDAINNHPNHFIFCPILQTSRGIYSPTKYYFRRGSIWHNATPGVHALQNRNILNSGILVALKAFEDVGGYNEKILLYFSDFDFVNRFAKKHKEMVVIDLVCQHSLSDIDNADIGSALRRFKSYVTGSYLSAVTATDYTFLFATIMLRSFKLAWQYKSQQFLQIFFKQYLFGKAS